MSEKTPKFRSLLADHEAEVGAFNEFYVAVPPDISFRTGFLTLVGPVLATLRFVGRSIGSEF
jgi:hypothetical protein